MSDLFDLDKLHKKQRRQKIQGIAISGLVILAIIFGGSLVLNNKKPAKHIATVSGLNNISNNSPALSSSAPTSTSTGSTNLSQEEAQDKALAAQDEAEAEKDIADAQSGQSVLNDEVPPSESTAITPVSIPPISTPPVTPTCNYPSNFSTLESNYLQADGAYNSFVSQIETPGGIVLPGVDAAGVETYEQNQLNTLQANLTQAQNAYEAAERSVSC